MARMNKIGVMVIDPDERAGLSLKAAVPWEIKGFRFIGVYASPPVLPFPLSYEPLLIITEINLKDTGFQEVFPVLREMYPEACLAVLTSRDDLAPALWAFRYGVMRYLLKPFKLEQVMELLLAADAACRRGGILVLGRLENSAQNAGIAGRVKAYVECHYTDRSLSLKSVADVFHLNYSYLSSLFHKHTGATYSDYVSGLRIRYVKQLLCESGMKMSEIAHAAGFCDSQVLYYAFKNATGMTPRAYRSAQLSKGDVHSPHDI